MMRSFRTRRTDQDEPPFRARRRYHLGVAGAIYIVVTLVIALGAFNSQNNLLFWAFGFSLALLIVSGILSGAMRMGLEIRRDPVAPTSAGEPATIVYRVSNRNPITPAFALTITEVDLHRRATEQSKGWRSTLTQPVSFVPHVGAGRTLYARAHAGTLRRGRVTLDAILVSTSFPFGIIKKSLIVDQPTTVIVRPALAPLKHGLVNAVVRTGDRGVSPTRRAGNGDEFFSLREYQPGDGLRAIAWRASARRDELLVRQTSAPTPLRLILILHLGPKVSEAMDELAISVVASMADISISRGLAVGVWCPATGLEIRPREGRRQRDRILDELAVLELASAKRSSVSEQSGPQRRQTSQTTFVVVHAGPVDRSVGPPFAAHLSADDPAVLAVENPVDAAQAQAEVAPA